jgi:hypothetical protein
VEKLRSAEADKLNPPDIANQDRAAQNWKPRLAPVKPKP